MEALVAVFWFVALVDAWPQKVTLSPNLKEIVETVNKLQTTWQAGHNFDHLTPEDITGLYGTIRGHDILSYREPLLKSVDVPRNFDSRTQWPNCASIREIRDQGNCGACWAFGAVEAMSDRYCIKSGGKLNYRISAEDLVSCCEKCGNGCFGGYPQASWEHWTKMGLVTGGQYGTKKGCLPFHAKPCEHHINGTKQPCGAYGPAPKCTRKCNGDTSLNYDKDKHFGLSAYRINSSVAQIQMEIMTNGPVEGVLTVYSDFITYKSGVYKHVTGIELGDHAIKIIGWGIESGIPYWLVANSWNSDWGDHGFFKIIRGMNECGIEDEIIAGLPDLK